MKKQLKGGNNSAIAPAQAPETAWGSILNRFGDGWAQFTNTLGSNTNVITKYVGGKRSNKRGGNLGSVISQAAVPGALLILNNAFKTRRKHKKGKYNYSRRRNRR
jgi:hypothetical protein